MNKEVVIWFRLVSSRARFPFLTPFLGGVSLAKFTFVHLNLNISFSVYTFSLQLIPILPARVPSKALKMDAGPASPNYQRLLERRQQMAAKREEEDHTRLAAHQKEDEQFEDLRARRVAMFEASLADLQKKHQTHSSEFLKSLKEKQRQEVIELETRHEQQVAQAETNISLQALQMHQSHEAQRQGLQNRLEGENKKRLESRALAQHRLDGKRYIEDYSLKDQVFKAFEKEAGTGRSSERPPLAPGCQSASSPASKNLLLHSPEMPTSKRQKIQATTPALRLESSLPSSPVDPVHVVPYHAEAGSEAALRTPQMSYKLKGFACGMRIWTAQPTESESCLSLQAAPVQQVFELYTVDGCKSGTFPQTVLEGGGDQKAFFNMTTARFELARMGRSTVKIEFKDQVELQNFLTLYREYYDEIAMTQVVRKSTFCVTVQRKKKLT